MASSASHFGVAAPSPAEATSAAGTGARCPPAPKVLYTTLDGSSVCPPLISADGSRLPPRAPGCLRVVCISDTHNEHESLAVPPGDLLIHAGDILTASGRRHVDATAGGAPRASAAGVALFERFAAWIGAQPHAHKLIIAGNHDKVLQCLGRDRCRAALLAASGGSALYLEHEAASVGELCVFGSPRATWGGSNDAFFCAAPDHSTVPAGTHIVVTHMPPLLPDGAEGSLRGDVGFVDMLHRVGARLHVGGHCHWAHGLYNTASLRARGPAAAAAAAAAAPGGRAGAVPCVIASNCEAKWESPPALRSEGPRGARGDALDATLGGYNLMYPIIVVDVLVPGGPPPSDARWSLSQGADKVEFPRSFHAAPMAAEASTRPSGRDGGAAASAGAGSVPLQAVPPSATEAAARPDVGASAAAASAAALMHPTPTTAKGSPARPSLLFFGPPNDPAAAARLPPLLRSAGFDVVHFDDAAEAITFISASPPHEFAAAVIKLGTRGNLGVDILRALRAAEARRAHGKERPPRAAFIAIHSSTAAADPDLRAALVAEHSIDIFATHSNEEGGLLAPLREVARRVE